ncbi:MAG: hypothetical protein KDA72_06915 [Planctomycetales bacterium]|nr:hypothetical protein [Planctomycetales bacterium]
MDRCTVRAIVADRSADQLLSSSCILIVDFIRGFRATGEVEAFDRQVAKTMDRRSDPRLIQGISK